MSRANLEANPADVASIDAIIDALYSGISFEAGNRPDWKRLRTLFLPGARLVLAHRPNGSGVYANDVEGWISDSDRGRQELRVVSFSEWQIGSRVDVFRDVAHVFSSYESRSLPTDSTSSTRGVNSIQLLRTDGRWWIVSVLWDVEAPGHPIP